MLLHSPPADKIRIQKIIVALRRNLFRFQPRDLHDLSYFILALDRFPLVITNLVGTATFTGPRTEGNYEWVGVEVSENSLKLNRGTFFAEGYEETHNIYEANSSDLYAVGDIDEWLAVADGIFKSCTMTFDILSDDRDIDWDNDYLDPDIDDEHIKEQLSYSRMLGVAVTYYEWIEDPDFGIERALKFKRLANSILLVANEVGPTWNPPDPVDISLLGNLGRFITGD
jgi:hypothetical protein